MAIIINGKSKCAICGKLINKDEAAIGFPHFIQDENSPLFFFSDRGFHENCFLQHPLSEDVLKSVKKYDERL